VKAGDETLIVSVCGASGSELRSRGSDLWAECTDVRSGLRGKAQRTETGTGCARSGLHRSDGLAQHTRDAAQSGPYNLY